MVVCVGGERAQLQVIEGKLNLSQLYLIVSVLFNQTLVSEAKPLTCRVELFSLKGNSHLLNPVDAIDGVS